MARRAQEKAWLDFTAWCRARRLTPLPAHPWTVAAYANWCESRYRYSVLVTHIRVISRAHLLSCCAPPDHHLIVARTLRVIEARERTRSHRASLFPKGDCTPTALTPDFDRGEAKPALKPPWPAGRSSVRTMAGQPRLVSRRPRAPS
jgi:hypothetical protein